MPKRNKESLRNCSHSSNDSSELGDIYFKVLAGILTDRMAQDEVLRKSALHDDAQIFQNSVFVKAYVHAAMDSFKKSREMFDTLFSDPRSMVPLKRHLLPLCTELSARGAN